MQGLSFAWPVILFQTSWIYSLWNLTLEKEVQGKVSVSKSEFFAKEWAIFFWPTAQGLIQAQCVLGETRPKRLKSCNIKSSIHDLITFYPGTPFQAPWNIFQNKKYISTLWILFIVHNEHQFGAILDPCGTLICSMRQLVCRHTSLLFLLVS